ncbi:tRNA (34-2'-O)-methyltransferase regulator WDR6 [Ochlerotatus camptorhynchus]|uniref:tRNA (34-2'-O)-methyltransferase regulator WDR6 n=1 Tax=Ochlerotatus camptorhynchus TaxID=644619 RepID=UPI0031DB43AE
MQVQTDATCVRVLSSEKLLLAIGNQLVLLSVDGSGLTRREPVRSLPRLTDKIHGIDYRLIEAAEAGEPNWLIVIHAGRDAYSIVLGNDNTFSQLHRIMLYDRVSELLYYPENRILMTHAARRSNDWISTLKLLEGNTVCVITGHGVAIHFCQNYVGAWIFLDQCPCEDGSTLYCSQIVGSNWKDLFCFSGTALGLLVVWRPFGQQKGRILCSISAHKGVVFSIECDLERRFLTTTSDDRSVKFWRMTLSEDGTGMNLKEITYCFGHTARVFQSRIIRGNDAIWVVSIGEDSNLCLWDELGNLVHKRRLEDGATLWNLDYDATTMTVFVCASNGNVSKFGIGQYLEANRGQQEAWDVTPDLNDDHLTKVKFQPNGSMVAVTNSNRILLLEDSHKPEVVDRLVNFECSILEVSNDRIFVAGNRLLNIYDLDQRLLNPSSSAKIRKLSDSGESNSSMTPTKQIEVDFNRQEFVQGPEEVRFCIIRSLHVCNNSELVLCDNNGRCLIYDLSVETLKSCHRLPKASERWLTFAFRLDQFLLLADRNGNLYLFSEDQTDPIFKLPNVHGKLGVTHIQLEEQTSEGCFLATTGHDGHVKSIFFDRDKLRLQVYEERKTAISWIDRICMANRLIMGFNDSRFVVARDEQDVLLTVDCGGGHRYWDFLLSDNGSGFRFVFIQRKRLKLVSSARLGDVKSLNALQVPRLSWHTKACNVVRIVRGQQQSGDTMLFVSGGEDNVLRINCFCAASGTLQEYPRKHLHCHISSIKTILSCEQLAYAGKVLILSAGGRAQLCLTTLDPSKPERTKQELCYMLLSSDSDRARWRTNRTASFDPETRFMCAVLADSESSKSSSSSPLFIGCSDGFLRQFVVRQEQDSFKVDLVREVYYGRCFLHITKVTIGTRTVIVTMATDGFVCFWDSDSLTEPFHKLKHHASGINAFDLKRLDSGGRFLIGTGSDDQTVAVTRFQLSTGNYGKISINQQGTVLGEGLHVGQVTGVRFGGDSTLWSTGVDQRVYLTDFSGWKNMIVLKKLHTCVADVKGLELIPESQSLFVYGWGFEFIDLRT